VDLVPGEDPLVGRKEILSLPLPTRTLIPSWRSYLHDLNLITSQRPQLQIPSYCGVVFQFMNLGGLQIFSPW
jgi:hypothetical protein